MSHHQIGPESILAEAPLRAISGPGCGAVCTFVGQVREQTQGRAVVALEYEAFEAMALKMFARIELDAQARWPGCRVAIHHRVGRLVPGEISVAIAAAAPHRDDAFAACRLAIEALKKDAPIWKRELFEDGSEWVGLGS
jgi:molybdopterin synthase catalytic subunit